MKRGLLAFALAVACLLAFNARRTEAMAKRIQFLCGKTLYDTLSAGLYKDLAGGALTRDTLYAESFTKGFTLAWWCTTAQATADTNLRVTLFGLDNGKLVPLPINTLGDTILPRIIAATSGMYPISATTWDSLVIQRTNPNAGTAATDSMKGCILTVREN